MDHATINYYRNNATEIAKRYESVKPPLAECFQFAFPSGSSVLEIGCGSGRDLSYLLQQGYEAYGIEPAEEMIKETFKYHPELKGRIQKNSIPLQHLLEPNKKFDCVLCSAVLMHLPPNELFDAALSIRDILNRNGRVIISLPLARSGLDDKNRDQQGRLFSEFTPDEIQFLFEQLGFDLLQRHDNNDSLGRNETSWFTMVFEYRYVSGVRPLDQIEGVLNNDKKTTTYKLALCRALAEIAKQSEQSARWQPCGHVGVPVHLIAQCWLRYYWPIVADGNAPQINANKIQLKFEQNLKALIGCYEEKGEHSGFSTWYLANLKKTLTTHECQLQAEALKNITAAIIKGPVEYSGGASELGRVFQYDKNQKLVLMSPKIWQEFATMGHWIIDSVILRWANLTAQFGKEKGITPQQVIPLLLAKPEPTRFTKIAKEAFKEADLNRCTWTSRSTRNGFDVDHAIPFSIWGNNDLWNLLQANKKANGNKSNKLPSETLLKERRKFIIEDWKILHESSPTLFTIQANQFQGNHQNNPLEKGWEHNLFQTFKKAIELTAIHRGIERWHGMKEQQKKL